MGTAGYLSASLFLACVRFGRRPKTTPDEVMEIKLMRETMTVPQIMKATGLSKASVYRALG